MDETEFFYCTGGCGLDLPVSLDFLFPSQLARMTESPLEAVHGKAPGTANCRACQTAANKRQVLKRRQRSKGRICEVVGCDGLVAYARSERRCLFHHLGGLESLCGCLTCRAGWWAPQHIATDSEKAAQHCWLYLVRISAPTASALVFGVSTVLAERMTTYRRECRKAGLSVEEIAKAPGDLLACVEAESRLAKTVRQVPALADISGMAKESAEDTPETEESFQLVAEWLQENRRASDPDGWESRRISYL